MDSVNKLASSWADEIADAMKYTADDCLDIIDSIRGAGANPSDRAVFEKVVWFLSLLDKRPVGSLSPYITILLEQPDGDEWFAHYLNEGNSLSKCKTLLASPPVVDWLPAPLRGSFKHRSTPVSDCHMVSAMVWEAYMADDYDQTTISVIAQSVTDGIVSPDAVRFMGEESMSPRQALEYVSLLLAVPDIIQRTKSKKVPLSVVSPALFSLTALDRHARNHVYSDKYFDDDEDIYRESIALCMETEEDFAQQAALFRFMLTSRRAPEIIPTLRYDWVGTPPENDMAWADLIREYSSPHEVDMLARLYDERGCDAETARKYIEENTMSPLYDAWL